MIMLLTKEDTQVERLYGAAYCSNEVMLKPSQIEKEGLSFKGAEN